MIIKNALIKKIKSWMIYTWFYPLYIGTYIRRIHFVCVLKSISRLDEKVTEILDAGCGNGFFTYETAKHFPFSKTKGIDLDLAGINNQWNFLPNLKYKVGDVTKLQDKNHYDLILCIDVIDDIPNWDIVLNNFYTSLKEKGYLYIHFPKHPREIRVIKTKSINEYWVKDSCYSKAQCSELDLKSRLEQIGFLIIYERPTFTKVAVFAQEVDLLLLINSNLFKKVLRYFICPFLKILAISDLFFNKSGNCFVILCRKI